MIPLADTRVPPDINTMLAAGDHRPAGDPARTTSRPSSTSPTRPWAGWAQNCRRIVKGSIDLAIEARKNLDPLIALIDQSKPVLDSQTNTSDAIQAWASQPGHGDQ